MKKVVTVVSGVGVVAVLLLVVVALAGMYKFNYLASLEGYDADGNKIKTEEVVLTGDYVGMSVTQAQARAKADNTPFRVVMADGEAFAVTADYRPGRINATVENGVIINYTTEGEENGN